MEHTCGGGACCRGDYSGINFIEASYCPEPFATLEACLDCVKGEENYVHCGPRYTTCLCVCVCRGGRRGCDVCMCDVCMCDVCMRACVSVICVYVKHKTRSERDLCRR